MQRLAAFFLLPFLAACSPAELLNLSARGGGVAVERDVPYAPGPRHALDIYTPSPPIEHAPVLVFLYGGAWDSGSRDLYPFLGAALARSGIVTVIPDYRVYPAVRFPGFVEDAALATAWAQAHAARYGGDPGRLFLMGHSAGAQIATLLALDPRYLRAVGMTPADITGVIGLAGPYDFLPLRSPELKAIFGPEAFWPRSQPINYVTPAAPPMFLAAGKADVTVDPRNTIRLAERLRAAGVPVTERLYPGLGHRFLIGAFAAPLAFLAPVRSDVLDFIQARSEANSLPLASARAPDRRDRPPGTGASDCRPSADR